MKFICKVEKLSKAATAATKIINPKSTINILSNILIKTGDNVVIIQSTDLETTYEKRVPAAIINEGSITVSGEVFAKYLRELQGEDVAIDTSNIDGVAIICGTSRVELPIMSSELFPKMDDEALVVMRRMSGATLSDAIDAVLFSAVDESNGRVSGMRLDISENDIRTTATDGYRLARHQGSIETEMHSVVLTVTGAKTIAKAIEKSPQITVSIVGKENNHLIVEDGSVRVSTRTISMIYPDVERILTTPGENIILVKCEDLRMAIKRSSLFSDPQSRGISIDVAGNVLAINVQSEKFGIGDESLEIDHTGKNIQIAVKANYLGQMLDKITSDKVQITFGTEATPIHISGENEQSGNHFVLMPLRA